MAEVPVELLELMIERRTDLYDPWADLATRTGVELTWHHKGSIGRFKNPQGLTTFSELRVSLQLGLDSHHLRSTAAHEAVHLERGPFVREAEKREEHTVSLKAAKRLVDPVLFDALMALDRTLTWPDVSAVVDVDPWTWNEYKRWRKRVKAATAERAWAHRNDPVAWPPRWLDEKAHVPTYQAAARFAGVL